MPGFRPAWLSFGSLDRSTITMQTTNNPTRIGKALSCFVVLIAAIVSLTGCTYYAPTRNGGVIGITANEEVVGEVLNGMFGPPAQSSTQVAGPKTVDFGPGVFHAYSFVQWWAGPLGTPYGGAFAIFSDHFEFRGDSEAYIPYGSIQSISYYDGWLTAKGIVINTTRGTFKFTFQSDDMVQVTQTLKQIAQR